VPKKNNIKPVKTYLNVRRNERIKSWTIRAIDFNSKQIGVLKKTPVIRFLHKIKLDLIEISSKVNTSVCKLVNYSKYVYKLGKRLKKNKVGYGKFKEVRFKVNISERDLLIKVKRCSSFLIKDKKVKLGVFLRGKFIEKKETALNLLHLCVTKLSDLGRSEGIKVLGRSIQVFINPKINLKINKF